MTETNKNVLVDQQTVEKKLSGRLTTNKVNKWAFFACTMVGLLVLAALLIDTLIKGAGHLTPSFFTNFSSSTPSMAGIKGAFIGTIWLMVTIIPITITLGVGTAIYLEEYAKENALTNFTKLSIYKLSWCTLGRCWFTRSYNFCKRYGYRFNCTRQLCFSGCINNVVTYLTGNHCS